MSRFLPILLILVACLTAACTSARFNRPYDEVVEATHKLYPIYQFKTGGWSYETVETTVRKLPAYRDAEPGWDLDVRYIDAEPGKQHEIEIINYSKLWQRKTTIRIRALDAQRTEVKIKSKEEGLWPYGAFGLGYEAARMNEIRHALADRTQAGGLKLQ